MENGWLANILFIQYKNSNRLHLTDKKWSESILSQSVWSGLDSTEVLDGPVIFATYYCAGDLHRSHIKMCMVGTHIISQFSHQECQEKVQLLVIWNLFIFSASNIVSSNVMNLNLFRIIIMDDHPVLFNIRNIPLVALVWILSASLIVPY